MVQVRIKNTGGQTRECHFLRWVEMKESKAAGKSLCILSLGGLNGLAEFSVAHGYGQRELSNWRIVGEDRLKLLELSKEQRGFEVASVPKSTGRKRVPRVPRKRCKKTVDMWGNR
jgi:hypothetical protein